MTITRCPLCASLLAFVGNQLACATCRTAFSSAAFQTQQLPVRTPHKST